MKKRIISLILAVVMIASIVPMATLQAFADTETLYDVLDKVSGTYSYLNLQSGILITVTINESEFRAEYIDADAFSAMRTIIGNTNSMTWISSSFVNGLPDYNVIPYLNEKGTIDSFLNGRIEISEEEFVSEDGIVIPVGSYVASASGFTCYDEQNGKTQKMYLYGKELERVNDTEHSHTYSKMWDYNATHHWHNATCGHTDFVSGFGSHNFTEETNGNATTYTCACGYQKVVYNTSGDEEGEVIDGASFTGVSLTLSSDIYINFYMNLTDEARQGGTMNFDIGGRTVSGVTAKYNKTEKKYYFACPITALEMAETVTATFSYNDVDYIQEYSVEEYIEEIVGNTDEYGDKAVMLARKIANYGYYAQTYLASIHTNVTIGQGGYTPIDGIFGENKEYDIDVISATTALADCKLLVSGASEDLTFVGTTVYFDSATALNYYVKTADGVKPDAVCEGKDITITEYKGYTPAASEKVYIISVKGITATELDDNIVVTVNDKLIITGSVLAYCKAVMNKEGQTEAAKNAMAAFYEYHAAAVEYANQDVFPHHATLDEYSWKELKTVSNAISDGTIPTDEMDLFIGFAQNAETKKVVLNSENSDCLYVRIIGFNHDERTDGIGKAGITFMAVNSINKGYFSGDKGSDSSTYAIGWKSSPMRAKMQKGGEIYCLLPDELTNQIRKVEKYSCEGWTNSNNSSYSSILQTSDDDLFLLSYKEIGYNNSDADEGTKYQYIDCSICPEDWKENTGLLFSSVNATGYEFIQNHVSEYNNAGAMWEALKEAGGTVNCGYYSCSFLRSVSVNDYCWCGAVYFNGFDMNNMVWTSSCVAPCFCI